MLQTADTTPRKPGASSTPPAASLDAFSPFRAAHLQNTAKFREAARDPSVMLPTPPADKRPHARPWSASAAGAARKDSKRDMEEEMRVSMFGVAQRDAPIGGLDAHGDHTMPGVVAGAGPGVGRYDYLPKSFQGATGVSIPTSLRFSGTDSRQTSPRRAESATADGTSPGPAAYTPRPQRPHTAGPRLASSARAYPIALKSGVALQLPSKHEANASPGVGAYDANVSSLSQQGPATMSKSPRQPTAAPQGAASPGPGRYTPREESVRKQSPRAVVPKDNKSRAVLRSVNSLFYTTDRLLETNLAVPGVGSYNVPHSSFQHLAGPVSFPKAARSPSPSRSRPGSPNGKIAAAAAAADVATMPDHRTLAGRAARHQGYSFGKQRRGKAFVATPNKMLYRAAAEETNVMPGVGQYADTHGTIAASAQEYLRRSSPPRRDAANATRSPSPNDGRRVIVPGPGAYETSAYRSLSSALVTTHNRWLKEATLARIARVVSPTSRSAQGRRASTHAPAAAE
jgi:hypothetical protein